MRLWSSSWVDDERIPARYAAGRLLDSGVGFSDNLNPHFAWSEVPAGTRGWIAPPAACATGSSRTSRSC